MKNVSKHVWKPLLTLVVLFLLLFGADSVLNAGPSTWTNGGSAAGFPDGGVVGGGAANEFTYWTTPTTIAGTPRGYFDPSNYKMGVGTSAPFFQFEAARQDSDGAQMTLSSVAHGASTTSRLATVRTRGTDTAPTAVLNGDVLGHMLFYGQYDSTVGHMSPAVYMTATAANNFSASAVGARWDLLTVGQNSTTAALALTVDEHRNFYAQWDMVAQQLFGITRQGYNFNALGPTTQALTTSFAQVTCSIADCGVVWDEVDDLGDAIRDGTFVNVLCAGNTTGTCTFPNVAGQQLNTSGGSVVLNANGTVQYVYSSTASAWVQSSSSSGDGLTTQLVYVAKNGVNDTATYRGSAQFPYLTIQYAVTARAFTPTTQAEYLTHIVFNLAPGTFTENVTVPTRQFVGFIGDRTIVAGSFTFSLDNTLRFGSTASPAIGFFSAAGSSTNPINSFIVGDGADAVLISNNVTTPITGARFLARSTAFTGRIKDVNANTTSAFAIVDSSDFGCATTCNTDFSISWAGVTMIGNTNQYRSTQGLSISRFSNEHASLFGGPITVALAPTFSPGFEGCIFNAAGTKVFTGPASSLAVDSESNYSFVVNGWTLAGGATKVIGENLDGVATPIYTTSTLKADGATTFNGAVTLGDAAADAITCTGTATFTQAIAVNTAGGTDMSIVETGLTRTGAPLTLTSSTLLVAAESIEIDTSTTTTPTCAADGDVGRFTRYSKTAGATISICLCTKLANVYTLTALGTGDCT